MLLTQLHGHSNLMRNQYQRFDDATFSKYLELIEKYYDGTNFNWNAIMNELEQWWRTENHETIGECPFDMQQLHGLRGTAILALKREQRL
jgi:hypothetical protein